jgi:hypothetical protein
VEWVFGYASLRALGGEPAVLRGHERFWGVAMDNRVDLPGYKKWLRPDGTRPAVHVAFLDVRPAPGRDLPGVLLPADDLAALDRRERNYARADVCAHVEPCPGRVWTYVGRPEARARLARAGRVLVARAYLEASGASAEGLDVADLVRVDLP